MKRAAYGGIQPRDHWLSGGKVKKKMNVLHFCALIYAKHYIERVEIYSVNQTIITFISKIICKCQWEPDCFAKQELH